MKSIVAFFLSFLTFFASIYNAGVKVTAPEDKTDFTPVIRFMVESDNHVNYAGDMPCMRLNKSVKLGYAVADADKEYNKLDAVLFVGDIADNGRRDQFSGFKSTLDACVKDETQLLALLACKSHDGNTLGEDALQYFTDLTGIENDTHTVINGYHFIMISQSPVKNEGYSEFQRTWLKAQLDAAVKDDPSKPVFVAHHQHVKNTVYGSSDFDGWGVDYFRDILNQYPQVVHFSGHSHYPVNDPRSIWQGEFTAIGTGSMKYLEFTVEDQRTFHPDKYKQEAEFLMVEVDADNRIRVRGFDLMEQQVICEYIIDGPLSRDFTPEKQAAKPQTPVFKNANVKVTKSFGNYKLKFDRAEAANDVPVFLYRAYALDKDGNELKTAYYMPRYYSYTLDDTAAIDFGKLPDGAVQFKVVAETAYGVQSEPIFVGI